MKRLALLLLLAGCTRKQTAPDASADAAVAQPIFAAPTSDVPPAAPLLLLATDGGLAALLAGDAGADRLPVTSTEGDRTFDNGLRERLTEVPAGDPDAFTPTVRGDVQVGTPTSSVPFDGMDRNVAGLRPRLRACYESGLTKDAKMAGKLVVTFVVEPLGSVVSADIASNTGISPEVATCVKGVVMRRTFDPLPSARTTVTLPLSFNLSR